MVKSFAIFQMFQKYALNKLGNGRKNLMFCRKNGNGRDIKIWSMDFLYRI